MPMIVKTRTRLIFGGLLIATIILALVPFIQTAQKGLYQGVPPAYVDDDLYYYSRMKEVADGNPFLGNPHFIDYQDAEPVAFFAADWLAAAPLLLGVPFTQAVVLNFIAWSLIFVVLGYAVIRMMYAPPLLAAGIAFFSYAEVYWLIFRPVPMQEVFPFFLLFFAALILWLKEPSSRRVIWFLIGVNAASFYVYTYLWEINGAILGVVFLHMLVRKKWPQVRSLLVVAGGTLIFALPAIIYLIRQMREPFYWETMGRIGLVETHLPTIDVYLYGRWAVLVVILVVFIRFFTKEHDSGAGTSNPFVPFTVYTGIGLLIASVSNVLTGKDVAVAQHVGRFITLWVALFFPLILWSAYLRRAEMGRQRFRAAIFVILSLAGGGFLALNLRRSLPFQEIASTDTMLIQGYAAPLAWLEQRERGPVVLWANEDISAYVPILTKHYVFWGRAGGLYLMPTEEVENRYLAASISRLTTDDLVAAYKRFGGIGPFARYGDFIRKQEMRCLFRECEGNPSMQEWIGSENLQNLVRRQGELKKNMREVIWRYQVAYAIADLTKQEDRYYRSLPGARKVWSDDRFIIYELR